MTTANMQKVAAAGITADDICKVLVEKKLMLMTLILRYENDWDTAEDILALASMEALAHAEKQFKGESSLAGYIGAIAINAARRHARRQAIRKNTVGLFYHHEIGGDGLDHLDLDGEDRLLSTHPGGIDKVSPDKVLENTQMLERVQQVLSRIEKRMPDAYKTWYHYRLNEMSYQEIEEKTGVAPATARKQVFRVSKELEQLTGYTPKTLFA
jgi:RNA polymerase sigma factor (sigma-70 family)